jgi:hypothetical protein
VALENHFDRGCPSMPVDWSARLDSRGYHATSVKRPDTKARWVGATRQSEDDGWTEGDAIIAFDAEDPSTEPQSEPASRTTSRRRQSGEPLPRAQPPPTRVRKRRSCPQLALTTCAHDTCICSSFSNARIPPLLLLSEAPTATACRQCPALRTTSGLVAAGGAPSARRSSGRVACV